MLRPGKTTLLVARVMILAVALKARSAWSTEEIDYALHVAPILAAHCYDCHGPERQESNLRLDVRERAMAGGDSGEPAIVPRASAESPLFRFVAGLEPDRIMPPQGEGTPLSQAQIEVLKQWIDAGALWPDELAGNADAQITTDHWSFQPIGDYQPPVTAGHAFDHPIDRFIAAKLLQNDLALSPKADRVTLIRRLYLDVHGLLPTPQQVRDFAESDSKDAYAQLVEEVLESSHYGERWARHWLDVVRFGESTGFEVNRDRENAYHYRDYVIEAFNSDKSYRDFIVDQLAGDVAGDELGTGFLVGGAYDLVKSPDVNLTLMQRQDELADYVNTTGTAFLGLTIGCARCHNHKFDPILQKDYYSMQAIFAGVQHGERELQGERTQRLRDEIAVVESKLQTLEDNLVELRRAAHPAAPRTGDLLPAVASRLNVERFESVNARWVRFTILPAAGAEPCLDEFEIFATESDQNVALASSGGVPTASGTLPGYPIHQLKHINDGKYGNSHSWIADTAAGSWVQIELPELVGIDRIQWSRDREGGFSDRVPAQYRIETASEPGQWQTVASSAQRNPPDADTIDETDFLARLPQELAEQANATLADVVSLRAQLDSLRGQIPMAYIGTFAEPEPIHRLFRGEPQFPREIVEPDALSALGTIGLTNKTPERERRMALARWIASPQNPLTARVIVNRVWHYHFGTGLVATPSDFGKNGAPPSHPELLDWLAGSLIAHQWSLKWLHRQILLSDTYQQSSAPDVDASEKDAETRLLWRFPPRRLEAEAIRDCVLQVSGALNLQAGGPGFSLFVIDHENVHHYFPKNEFGPNEFRRMVYMTKIRQEQDDVFGVFDCPDGAQTTPRRGQSTTPLQALNLLNSEFMLQQSAIMARRVRSEAGDDASKQIGQIFQLAFSRDPDAAEIAISTALVREYGLESLCRAIFNSNEFLFLN